MINVISENSTLKNLIVEKINSKNLRTPIPPKDQQPDRILEHQLSQRINKVISAINEINKSNKGKLDNEKAK